MRRLLVMGAACHQITFIVVESWLFAPLRERAAALGEHPRRLLSCHLCFGTWVGLGLAALFRPRLAGGRRPGAAREVAGWLVDGFAVALVGRALNEVLAVARHEAALREEARASVEEQEPERVG